MVRHVSFQKDGGLGLRDYSAVNQAFLANQCWNIIIQSDSLVAKIFKSIYFPNSTFQEVHSPSKASIVRKSLLWCRYLLSKGLKWIIGIPVRLLIGYQVPQILN